MSATSLMDEQTVSFRNVHLDQVDPSFQAITEDFYNLRISSAEIKKFVYKPGSEKAGTEGEYVNLGFTIVNHPTFNGRRIYESLFENGFSLRIMRRLQDATGIPQNGDTESWLATLASKNPVVKLKVSEVDDLMRDGMGGFVPNPKTIKADGSPATKNVVDWKAGVVPGDSQ